MMSPYDIIDVMVTIMSDEVCNSVGFIDCKQQQVY